MDKFKSIFSGLMIFASCPTGAVEKPFFENSIVSNDIDFIASNDPTAKSSTEYLGTFSREMPDKRNDSLFDERAHVFKMTFTDSAVVEILAHSDFADVNEAMRYSNMLAGPIGKLPFSMRDTLSHVVIHKGDQTAFSEHLGHFFVLYSENMETRIHNNDLEETIFHESVHATLDHEHREASQWIEAQRADGVFVTNYAAQNPDGEDFAESALFAYTLKYHPNRISTGLRDWLVTNVPNRIAYLNKLFDGLEQR